MRPHNALVDDTELRRLVARSMGHKQIAKHFHCSPITVRKRLRALRLVAPTDASGSMGGPSNLPKVRLQRSCGSVSLPAISMFISARQDVKP